MFMIRCWGGGGSETWTGEYELESNLSYKGETEGTGGGRRDVSDIIDSSSSEMETDDQFQF